MASSVSTTKNINPEFNNQAQSKVGQPNEVQPNVDVQANPLKPVVTDENKIKTYSADIKQEAESLETLVQELQKTNGKDTTHEQLTRLHDILDGLHKAEAKFNDTPVDTDDKAKAEYNRKVEFNKKVEADVLAKNV